VSVLPLGYNKSGITGNCSTERRFLLSQVGNTPKAVFISLLTIDCSETPRAFVVEKFIDFIDVIARNVAAVCNVAYN